MEQELREEIMPGWSPEDVRGSGPFATMRFVINEGSGSRL